jgi:L-histidine Nalpha-methyltransferase
MASAAQAVKKGTAEFAKDVLAGLSSSPRYLSSKYFYDEKGDAIFRQIMQLDEYYLTRCELEIFQRQTGELNLLLSEAGSQPFQLIELGAGDGSKTKVLIRELLRKGASFKYVPIDISAHAVEELMSSLRTEFPSLDAEGIADDYFEVLNLFDHHSRKVVLFMGANIGNYRYDEASRFIKKIADALNPGDILVIGFDLKKDPARILAAYNDKKGVTRNFNLNLLERINRELGGNFDPGKFIHYPLYDPVSGEARSYIISACDQQVRIDALDMSFQFSQWEPIHTEVSKKYSLQEVRQLAEENGFSVKKNLFDEKENFVDSVWTK